MTREEAIKEIRTIIGYYDNILGELSKADRETVGALTMAIEALEAQDRPIICPRCGRTFAESEGRE